MTAYLPDALGILAGLLSSGSFVPQVMKVWRGGDTRAISTRMYLVTVTAFTLWIGYGLLLGSVPLVVFNLASLALSASVLVLKLRRRGRTEPPPHASG